MLEFNMLNFENINSTILNLKLDSYRNNLDLKILNKFVFESIEQITLNGVFTNLDPFIKQVCCYKWNILLKYKTSLFSSSL